MQAICCSGLVAWHRRRRRSCAPCGWTRQTQLPSLTSDTCSRVSSGIARRVCAFNRQTRPCVLLRCSRWRSRCIFSAALDPPSRCCQRGSREQTPHPLAAASKAAWAAPPCSFKTLSDGETEQAYSAAACREDAVASDIAMAALYLATGRVDDADSFLQRAQSLDGEGTMVNQETLHALVQDFRSGLQDAPLADPRDTPLADPRDTPLHPTALDDPWSTAAFAPHARHGVTHDAPGHPADTLHARGDTLHARDGSAGEVQASANQVQLPLNPTPPAASAGQSAGSLSAPRFRLQAVPNPVLARVSLFFSPL